MGDAVKKMIKIKNIANDRDASIAESKQSAIKKQKELSEMIK